MKISYVTVYDARDVKNWSGLGFYIAECLKQFADRLDYIGPLSVNVPFPTRIKSGLYNRVLHRGYDPMRSAGVRSDYNQQILSKLSNSDADVVMSPSSIPISKLNCKKPIVLWTDATFSGLVGFYPEFMNLSDAGIKEGMDAEQEALSNCKLAIYSSQWAADCAIHDYKVEPSKVHVVPYGANVEVSWDLPEIEAMIAARSQSVCKILFVGVNWHRKGGAVAVQAAQKLLARGTKVELHIVGCQPKEEVPDFVIQHGFISKSTPEGRKKISDLFASSHFFILPSLAECCAVAFAEANAFGLPCLATNVGGITTAVRDGVNGKTFPITEDPAAYANFMYELFSDYDRYHAMAIASFNEYRSRLNWRASAQAVKQLLETA